MTASDGLPPLPHTTLLAALHRVSRSPEEVATIRRSVAAQLAAWQLQHVEQQVMLIVSELITNAITHGKGQVWLALKLLHTLEGPTLRIEVCDHGAWPGESPRFADSNAEHGRGLLLVQNLADEAGHSLDPLGHVAWAHLRVSDC
ncbi:ATP-binding protein [Streptomyces sp. CA-251387]|uniref:ATP-binding protein n=1 Tax=Streptomyces sp. CA-251387 TaxID=3240064 RepID=UPI003D8E46A4